MSTVAATAIIAQRNKIIRRFKQAGATSPDRPIDPATLQIRQSLIFNKLVRDGVLVKVSAHHFYLNESRATEYRTQRQQVVLVVLAVIAIAVIILFFLRWL